MVTVSKTLIYLSVSFFYSDFSQELSQFKYLLTSWIPLENQTVHLLKFLFRKQNSSGSTIDRLKSFDRPHEEKKSNLSRSFCFCLSEWRSLLSLMSSSYFFSLSFSSSRSTVFRLIFWRAPKPLCTFNTQNKSSKSSIRVK